MTEPENILVIKLSAFGDFIQSLGAMAAIRHHHPAARITLLTTTPFVSLGRECGYFDNILIDPRPRMNTPGKWVSLAARLRGGHFDRVYDLQCTDRTALYYRVMKFGRSRKLEWIGTALGASHRDTISDKKTEHAIERHSRMLKLAGIDNMVVDDLHWVRSDTAHFGLPHPYVLLIPGCAPTRLEKRWPAESYGGLANILYGWGFTPVVIGTAQEADLGKTIRNLCPHAIDLCGLTSILDLVGLARAAAGAIGNDTGPMHMIGATGCPSTVLFSQHSNPALHAPRGARVRSVQVPELDQLSLTTLLETLSIQDFRHKGATPA